MQTPQLINQSNSTIPRPILYCRTSAKMRAARAIGPRALMK